MTAARPSSPAILAVSLLAAFALWHAFGVDRFARRETVPPAWDQANHLDVALSYREALEARRPAEVFHFVPKEGVPPFPPAYHLALAVFSRADNAAWASLWVNWLYFLLLCAAIFGLARDRGADALAAAAAAAMFAGAPVVQWLLREQLVDLPLTACVAAAYWALGRSDRFRRPGASIAFGLLHAFGMLHKWSFFSYLLPAYFIAARALADRGARRNVLTAAALSAVAFAPWYLARLPLLARRLVQASADQAVPFWRGGAFFQYLLSSPGELGAALGWLGWGAAFAALARRRKADAVLLGWLFASYVFWAIVPNRQYRYLLPGLPALAVLACERLPRRLLYAAAVFQALLAVSAFWRHPVRGEAWPMEEILSEARGRSGGTIPTIVLVANDERFNELTFMWTAHRFGLPATFRSVNSTLWETSPFVLVKEGRAAPEQVAYGLAEAAATIKRPGGWFSRVFREARRWPLPDASHAVLFERRMLERAPLGATMALADQSAGSLRFARARLTLGRWDGRRSVYRSARFCAETVELRGLTVRDVCAAFEDVLPVPDGQGGLRLARLGKVRLESATVEASALERLLRDKGLPVERVELDRTIRMSGRVLGVPFGGEAALTSRAGSLEVKPISARVGPIVVPMEWIERFVLNGPMFEARFGERESSVRTALRSSLRKTYPIGFELSGLTIARGRLTVP